MTLNPLFPGSPNEPDQQDTDDPGGYLLPQNNKRVVKPLNTPETDAKPAISLVRQKLAQLYSQEPAAKEELEEAEEVSLRSPHQQFMYDLSHSGKGLAEIQTQWHVYYASLPDEEKRRVWQEFYEANNIADRYRDVVNEGTPPATKSQAREVLTKPKQPRTRVVVSKHADAEPDHRPKKTSQDAIKRAIKRKVADRADKLSRHQRQNLRSVFFGLTCGFSALFIIMFSFFNEVIIAPFIQPGRADATPIIVDDSTAVASGVPKVIIPKINVQIPVVYNATSDDESVIEGALLQGVVHYPTTVLPGQTGNAAFFGHSSNNIFNKGQYKFAFVLLHTLSEGDTFYLTYNNTVYAYKVISRRIVDPSEIGVLNDVPGQKATATLITCDPPGTSLHRLVVVGQQISPDPNGNSTGTNTTVVNGTTHLASNGPSLWSRFWHWL
jgi:sortase A